MYRKIENFISYQIIHMTPWLRKYLWVNFDFSETYWKALPYPEILIGYILNDFSRACENITEEKCYRLKVFCANYKMFCQQKF